MISISIDGYLLKGIYWICDEARLNCHFWLIASTGEFMATISDLRAREVLDSRGIPTVETWVQLNDGSEGRAAAPSGVSRGAYETVELRDGGERRQGLGVLKAVENVNTVIKNAVVGMESNDQAAIDQKLIALDGSANKQNLGGNSLLTVSLAVSVASANSLKLPLYLYLQRIFVVGGESLPLLKIPTPIFNMINGGKHGYGNLDFQEYQIIPDFSLTFTQALDAGIEIYLKLGRLLAARGAVHSVGDEGGYAPDLFTNIEAFKYVSEAAAGTDYKVGEKVFLGTDIAPAYFIKDGNYQVKDTPNPLTAAQFLEYLENINSQFHLHYIEDPISEDDWEAWQLATTKFSAGSVVIGDDLLATNIDRLNKAIEIKACTGILVKPNQAGTLTETLQVVKKAKEAGMKTVISHRLGETTDSFIADLAVAVGADYVKFGAPVRGERVVKYNRLSQIEAELQ